jgi:hypothetical protein
MTTKIFAEQLKEGDVIVIQASSQTDERRLLVERSPELNELTVDGFAFPIRNGIVSDKLTPIQFGRKVDLEIERSE